MLSFNAAPHPRVDVILPKIRSFLQVCHASVDPDAIVMEYSRMFMARGWVEVGVDVLGV